MFFLGASTLTVIIPRHLWRTEVLLYLLKCWLKLVGMTCLIMLCGEDLKSLPKIAQEVCGMAGKGKDGW